MKNVFIVSASLAFLLVGCGSEQEPDIKLCKDLVPYEVIVNDFIEYDSNGTYALYMIQGRVKIVVPLRFADYEINKDKKRIKYKLSRPCVDDKGVTFNDAKTKILKQDRSVFTTLKEDDRNHYELRKEAVKKIREVVIANNNVFELAMDCAEEMLKSFYRQFNYTCEIQWTK